MTENLFDPKQFTPTKFSTAEDKAKFCKQFVQFVESDFEAGKFPKWFYTRLSMTFGHIAHYSQGGFFETFFLDPRTKLEFLLITVQYPAYGNAACTFCDAEAAIAGWVLDNHIVEKYQAICNEVEENREKAELARLSKKYNSGIAS